MDELERVIYDIERCTCHVPDACRDCSKYASETGLKCMENLMMDALELLKEQEQKSGRLPVKPTRGNDDNYYCGKCGAKITNAIKIYDGERYMTSHPDHLKPVNKWWYCHNCGRAVKWDG